MPCAPPAPPVGIYSLASLQVQVDANRKVTEVGKTNLAGSALTLDHAVRNTCHWCDLPLESVWPLASQSAAAAIGIQPMGTVDVAWDPAAFTLTVQATHP